MKFSTLQKFIPTLYEARTPIHIVGAPGASKSQQAMTWPGLLEQQYGQPFGLVTYTLPGKDAVDVHGFLVPTKTESGEHVSIYTKPDLMRLIDETGMERGIVFLDEFAQSSHDVQKAVAHLLSERNLNGFALPDGWWVVMASNRAKDRAGVKSMLAHVQNRMFELEVELPVEDWADWALAQGLDYQLVAFAKFKPGVMATEVPTERGPFCTWRSFTYAAEVLAALRDDADAPIPSDPDTVALVSGVIGHGAATELFAFLSTHEFMPSRQDVANDPGSAELPPMERLDAAYAAAQLAVDVAREHKDKPDVVDNCFAYLERLPQEIFLTCARDLMKVAPGAAMRSERYGQWLMGNQSLVQSTYA